MVYSPLPRTGTPHSSSDAQSQGYGPAPFTSSLIEKLLSGQFASRNGWEWKLPWGGEGRVVFEAPMTRIPPLLTTRSGVFRPRTSRGLRGVVLAGLPASVGFEAFSLGACVGGVCGPLSASREPWVMCGPPWQRRMRSAAPMRMPSRHEKRWRIHPASRAFPLAERSGMAVANS